MALKHEGKGARGQGDKERERIHRVPLSPLLLVSLYLIPLSFLALFYFYPLFSIFRLSLAPGGQLALTALRGLVSTPYYLRTLWFTTWQAALSTLLTLLAALPAAYVFAHYQFPGKSLLQALTTIPFVLPTIVVAAAFTSLLGPRGWVNQALMAALGLDRPPVNLVHTLAIILLAHVFYNYTIILRMVGGFWANLPPQLEAAARMLGASPWRAFREVTLPLLRPALTAASLLVFLFDFTSFGVILILGGPHYATLEVEIYRQAVNLFNLPVAAALSLLQIGCTFGLMVIYTRLQQRITVPLKLRPRRITARRPRTWGERWLVGINVTVMILLLVVPLLSLAERSLSTGQPGYSLAYYRELSVNRQSSIFFVPPLLAVRNSLLFAGATVGLALMLGLISAWLLALWNRDNSTGLARQRGRLGRLLDPVFMLPLGTSAVTLGFGYIIALAKPPLNLRTSPVLIPLAHTLVALPFVVRSLLPVIRGIHPHLREAARVLGASSWRVWREVDLPIVGRALLVGAVFAFTVSLGEFGATVFVARPQMPTMPVVIYRFLGQPGAINYGQALAMSTLLMIVCAAGFLAIERFRYGEVGEF
jgi:thiamine transport system permease protein